ERGAESWPGVHAGSGLGPRRHQMREQVAVLGVEQDGPEVLPVVVLVAEQVAGELDHGFWGVKFARGRLPGLAHNGPGRNLQAVTLRVHFWTPGVVGRAEAQGRAQALGRLRMAPRPCPS